MRPCGPCGPDGPGTPGRALPDPTRPCGPCNPVNPVTPCAPAAPAGPAALQSPVSRPAHGGHSRPLAQQVQRLPSGRLARARPVPLRPVCAACTDASPQAGPDRALPERRVRLALRRRLRDQPVPACAAQAASALGHVLLRTGPRRELMGLDERDAPRSTVRVGAKLAAPAKETPLIAETAPTTRRARK